MPKLPYMPFYVSDWTSDPQLAMCSLSTRACWLELLCGMHSLGHMGVITGTADQLARVCRCSVAEFVQSANELRDYHVGEVSERDGKYTIVNRRMKREYEASNKAKARQEKFNGEKTRNKREINAETTPDIHIQFQNNNHTPRAHACEDPCSWSNDASALLGDLFPEWQRWLSVWSDMHGNGRPMNEIIQQAQLEKLLRLPAEVRRDALKAAIAGGGKNIQDIRESGPVKRKGGRNKPDIATPPVFSEDDRDDDIDKYF